MPVKTNAEGGGGVGSDECTLLRANVPIGFKAVTADSNDESMDGTFNPDTTAADSHVLEGQSYIKFNPMTKLFERRFGARKNNGSLSASLNCGESFIIPVGDTLGGKVTANSLASQTPGTATAADIILGKKATVNGIILTGTKPNNGTINATLNCGQSKSLLAGSIDGGEITAASLASQTPGNLAANKMLAGTYGVSKGVRVDGDIASVGGPSIIPQTYGQAIDVSGRYLTSNGYVAGVALPPAEALKKGYRYWIGGNYVDGNYQGYVDSPLYLFNSGAWGGLQTTGVTKTKGGDAIVNGSYIELGMFNTDDKAYARLNQTVDLTNYKYLKMYTESSDWNIFDMCVGISTDPSIVLYSNLNAYNIITGVPASGTAILDVSGFNGFYYIYIAVTRRGGSGGATGRVKQLFLSTT